MRGVGPRLPRLEGLATRFPAALSWTVALLVLPLNAGCAAARPPHQKRRFVACWLQSFGAVPANGWLRGPHSIRSATAS
jgi:hypothetical protein